jgi:uncharacterized protein
MLYILFCKDNPSVSKKIRAELLDQHLAYLEKNKAIIFLGGAILDEDGSTRLGSTLVLNVPGKAEAVAFSADEPFRKAGLYEHVEIHRMRRAQWNPTLAPTSVDGH